MGLAPSGNGGNSGKTAVAKVPVPIFSQPLSVVYSLSDAGEKELTFGPGGVTVAIRHPSRFVEHLPLLIGPDDRLDVGPEQTQIQRNGTALRIVYDQKTAPELRKTAPRGCEKMGLAPSRNGENPGKTAVSKVPVPIFSQPRTAGPYSVVVLRLQAEDRLDYSIRTP
jgi:hypothetical protein